MVNNNNVNNVVNNGADNNVVNNGATTNGAMAQLKRPGLAYQQTNS